MDDSTTPAYVRDFAMSAMREAIYNADGEDGAGIGDDVNFDDVFVDPADDPTRATFVFVTPDTRERFRVEVTRA